jgi:D-alanyl-D-alanine carboxypeptidase
MTQGTPPEAYPRVPVAYAILRRILEDARGHGAPGAFVRIDDDGATRVLVTGVGDLRTGTPIDPHGRFRVGSITKTFTTVLVLRLVEEGCLGLDDTIRRHLPELMHGGAPVTVRQLLAHRSGLHNYLEEMALGTVENFEAVRYRAFAPEDLVRAGLAHPSLFPPGSGFGYSNTNYILLGLLIEKLTGRSYADELRAHITSPLGLSETSCDVTTTRIEGVHARGYLTPERPGKPLVDATEQTRSWSWSAGAIISSAADVNRFYASLLGGRLLGPAALQEMLTPMSSDFTGTSHYCLGLRRVDLSCGVAVYGHAGTAHGYITYAFTAADGRRAVTISTNISHNPGVYDAFGPSLEAVFCARDVPGMTVPGRAL